jgi:hypothetical protein
VPCGQVVPHTFAVVNATPDGLAAQARIVLVTATGFNTSHWSNTLPAGPFTLSVPESCQLTVTVMDGQERTLRVVRLAVPAGSRGQVHQLAL